MDLTLNFVPPMLIVRDGPALLRAVVKRRPMQVIIRVTGPVGKMFDELVELLCFTLLPSLTLSIDAVSVLRAGSKTPTGL